MRSNVIIVPLTTKKKITMTTENSNITLKGNKLTIIGSAPKVGNKAPDFKLTAVDMKDITLTDYQNKILVLIVVPSLDTPVCAIETKRFNQEASNLSDEVELLVVSVDLPMAQNRWCGLENIKRVKTASDYKYRNFGENYGVFIQENALLTRSVFIVDKSGILQYVEYVSEIAEEPNYQQILNKIKELV